MAFEFKLPDIGEGVVEGELVRWLVDEGQQLEEDAPMFEILTDKVSAVIPSPRKGVVARRHFKEGDMVPVGAVVVTLADSEPTSAAPVQLDPAKVPVAVVVDIPKPAPIPAAPQVAVAKDETDEGAAGQVRAAPATRKLARDLGVDLAHLKPTGDNGRVTRQDVELAAAKPPAAPATRSAPTPTTIDRGPDEERIALRGLRRKILQKMRESKDHAAHFTYVDEVDFTAVNALRGQLEERGLKTTLLPFVVKAAVQALRDPEFRLLNASIDEAAGEIVVKRRYHVGIAVATEPGLVVPVVRDVDRKTLRELAAEVKRIGDGARAGTLKLDEMSGSTFTITSLGKLGGMFATPIINYPEVAILGLHKVEKRPVVIDDQIVIRERMYMTCSFDHRLIDGHVGAAFVQRIKDLLENPGLLLADLA
ncbi:MAG: dihydrolipoamide acetyltransferase family protein [Myxococcota bacterium]